MPNLNWPGVLLINKNRNNKIDFEIFDGDDSTSILHADDSVKLLIGLIDVIAIVDVTTTVLALDPAKVRATITAAQTNNLPTEDDGALQGELVLTDSQDGNVKKSIGFGKVAVRGSSL